MDYYKIGDKFDFSRLFPKLLRDGVPMYGYISKIIGVILEI